MSTHEMTDHVRQPMGRATTGRIIVRSLIASAGMMACAFAPGLLHLIPAYAQWMSVEHTGAEGTAQLLVLCAQFVIAPVAALLLLGIALRIEKARWRDYFGRVGGARAGGVLLAATAAAALVTFGGSVIAHLSGTDVGRPVPNTEGLPVIVMIVYGLARAFVLQGIQEEWWFRGFAFRGYERRPWLVLGVTTVMFTLLHLASQGGQTSTLEHVLYLVLPLGMGFWAGVERWCTGTVWGAVGVHGGIHTGLIAPAMLGWSQGSAAWVIIGVALCLAGGLRLAVSRPWRTG